MKNDAKVAISYRNIVYRIKCPYCDTINWVNDGDPYDQTIPQKEALLCFKCQKKSWLDEELRREKMIDYGCGTGDEEELDGDLIEEAFEIEGEEKPPYSE